MGLLYPSCLLGFQGDGYLFSLQTRRYFPGMVYFNERDQVNVEEIKCALPKRHQEPSQQATGRNTGERVSGLRRLSFVGCDE